MSLFLIFCFISISSIYLVLSSNRRILMLNRSLEHSTILYEASSNGSLPLLRVSANTQDQHFVATFHLDSNTVHIIDIRFPGVPLLNLAGHEGNINCVKWAPGSRNICSTGGDDGQILIWNTTENGTLFDAKTCIHNP